MARYRKVDPRIWNDAKFRELSDNAKLVFFMILTHPSMTALGAMRATVAGLAAEMGWTSEAFGEAFRDVIAKGMAEHDSKACFVGLPNFIRYNEPESPNVVKAWVGALDLLPECEQRSRTVARAVAFAEAKGKAFAEALPEAFTEAWPKAMPYQEQEPEQEPEQKKKPSAKSTAKLPTCPVDRIVATYHELLPELPKVRVMDRAREKAIRERWTWVMTSTKPDGTRRAETSEQGLAWFRSYFERTRENDFLMGRTPRAGAHANWRPDIEFLCKSQGLKHVLEKTLEQPA